MTELGKTAPWQNSRFTLPELSELQSVFTDFQLQEPIGQGGMGVVYKAIQTRLDRSVAIKILPHELAQDEVFARRFLREAQAMAKLTHANIVAVHDAGQAGEHLYIVMELHKGHSL